jgi:hypothetical protein
MTKNAVVGATLVFLFFLSGCASVPMASKDEDMQLKEFGAPPENKAGLYIYRNTFAGQALKKNVYLDGEFIGETANKVYFYKVVSPGSHTLATESEFSDNSLTFEAAAGRNYYAEQYIKMGVFVGGANIRMVDEDKAKKAILECNLATHR